MKTLERENMKPVAPAIFVAAVLQQSEPRLQGSGQPPLFITLPETCRVPIRCRAAGTLHLVTYSSPRCPTPLTRNWLRPFNQTANGSIIATTVDTVLFRTHFTQEKIFMPAITTKDGIEIYYKDWGRGQPVVFSHGWPLSADDWDNQMLFFLHHGYRVIAHDRRGHGRSTQTADGHDMDHYADDLAALTAHLDLKNAIHVGHSTGGGEVTHYLARHGESRVSKAALISAVPPLMVKTAANPLGLPKEVFDGLQAQLAANRSQFYRDLPAGPFYGYNRPGAKPSEAIIQNWWRQGMMGGAKAHYDGIVAFSQTDFTEDLKKISVPVLVMHSEDDQIVPYVAAGPRSAKLLKNGTFKSYKSFPHGMPTTEPDTINADLLAFIAAATVAA
jgi:non-heme chloroperoxidase